MEDDHRTGIFYAAREVEPRPHRSCGCLYLGVLNYDRIRIVPREYAFASRVRDTKENGGGIKIRIRPKGQQHQQEQEGYGGDQKSAVS